MRIKATIGDNARLAWFWAYTLIFAVFAVLVFWGTWSPDYAPVMPDCAICHPPDWFSEWWRGWIATGKYHLMDLQRFIGSPYFWQELNYVIPLYLSGLAVAYFLRGRELPYLAAYGAGLFLAFCGYWMTLFSAGHAGWFQWMCYGPWAFGLIDRAVRKGKLKNWLLSGAVVGWACYWQTDLWLLFTTFVAVFFLFCEIENRGSFRLPRSLAGPIAALAVFFIIGGAGIRNAFVSDLAGRNEQIEKGGTIPGADKLDAREKKWIFVTNWSLPFEETCEFWNSRVNGDTSCPFTLALSRRAGHDIKPYTGALGRPKDARQGNYRQHSLYVGFVTCILALFGFGASFTKASEGNRRTIRFFAVSAFVCYLLSLGRNCEPVYRVVFALPFGDLIRCPVKWHHLTEFSLVILSGFGLCFVARLCAAVKSGAAARLAPWIVPVLILGGVADLALVDRLYCAPVDLRLAKRFKANMNMTCLQSAQLAAPEVKQMFASGRLVDLGWINRDLKAVAVLEPFKPNTEPMPPFGVAAWLSIISLFASGAVVCASVMRPRLTV